MSTTTGCATGAALFLVLLLALGVGALWKSLADRKAKRERLSDLLRRHREHNKDYEALMATFEKHGLWPPQDGIWPPQPPTGQKDHHQ